jgi:hypothetical protein
MVEAESKELSRELAESRARLSYHSSVLADRANVPRRLKRSITRRPATWMAAVAVIGLLIAARRPRKRIEVRTKEPVEKQAGKAALILGAGKLALDIFRPALTMWLRKKVAPSWR